MIKKYNLIILFVATIILSACHSRRAVMKGEPGKVVAPQPSIAEKYSVIMGVDANSIQNGRLYSFIDQWIGTPYRYGGLDHNGIDCSGLSFLLQQQVYGVNIPRTTSQQVQIIKRKYEEELQEGDLLFFDYDGKKYSHVGIYLQNGYYVHASSTKGVIITKLHDPYTYKYFSRCGSIASPDDSINASDSR